MFGSAHSLAILGSVNPGLYVGCDVTEKDLSETCSLAHPFKDFEWTLGQEGTPNNKLCPAQASCDVLNSHSYVLHLSLALPHQSH